MASVVHVRTSTTSYVITSARLERTAIVHLVVVALRQDLLQRSGNVRPGDRRRRLPGQEQIGDVQEGVTSEAASLAGFGVWIPRGTAEGRGRSPNDRLGFACIGVGGMGWADLHAVAADHEAHGDAAREARARAEPVLVAEAKSAEILPHDARNDLRRQAAGTEQLRRAAAPGVRAAPSSAGFGARAAESPLQTCKGFRRAVRGR